MDYGCDERHSVIERLRYIMEEELRLIEAMDLKKL